jgi:hypothetical protein
MTLEEANKRYIELSIKYHDCIPFHPDEDIEWQEVCKIVFDDLRISNPDMFIDIKKSSKDKYEKYSNKVK